jgi:hypothetical protein
MLYTAPCVGSFMYKSPRVTLTGCQKGILKKLQVPYHPNRYPAQLMRYFSCMVKNVVHVTHIRKLEKSRCRLLY